jgi:hypothetical protein
MFTQEVSDSVARKIVELATKDDNYFALQRTVGADPTAVIESIKPHLIQFVSETVAELDVVVAIQFPADTEAEQVLHSIRKIYLNNFLLLRKQLMRMINPVS